MRLAFCSLAFFVLLAGGAVGPATAQTAPGSQQIDESGFHITLPAGWKAKDTGKQDDDSQLFGWLGPNHQALVVQTGVPVSDPVPDTSDMRSLLSAFTDKYLEGMGMNVTRKTSSDDGTSFVSRYSGTDKQSASKETGELHLFVDRATRHLHVYAVLCYLDAKATPEQTDSCRAAMSTFRVTVDPQTMLPLGEK